MAGEIRVYTDEHISIAIVEGLRQRGVDVITFREAGLAGASDELHLTRATSQGRAVLTKDADFIKMHAEGIAHSGILFIPKGRTTGQIIRRLVELHKTITAADMAGKVQYL